jgi:2-amino-4-hydroxy-6-hydroxymethyldihydropteridine diphosphokinase
MNSLIIATGSNIGNKVDNLLAAQEELSKFLNFISKSRVFSSKAILYEQQPDFYNQVLEFKIPNNFTPSALMEKLLEVEKQLGRDRKIDKGPRTVDIDIIFWGNQTINEANLTVPHYDWFNRSFVVKPLHDLSCFQSIKKCFKIPTQFDVDTYPI